MSHGVKIHTCSLQFYNLYVIQKFDRHLLTRHLMWTTSKSLFLMLLKCLENKALLKGSQRLWNMQKIFSDVFCNFSRNFLTSLYPIANYSVSISCDKIYRGKMVIVGNWVPDMIIVPLLHLTIFGKEEISHSRFVLLRFSIQQWFTNLQL